ncbi:FAD-binding monooxygenase [Lentzea sp. NBRC 105346]|uniref:FAD-dependent oxidoreductase n=1 Tax=Lentzea sp. NBRC 105346 TaxID=3032205 RepID=UPI0024A3EEE7|nr:FAD-dependent monooxygenase [Lentzea sp. NBRC 105346]GLZ29849.1 FAD-binding monooxygenase [Lentzea sp. NBRC 105346]
MTEVLIVGGGLAGLSAAVFLAQQGVDCLLVEKHQGVSPHPRARGITPAVMELMRKVGLEEAIRNTESGRALQHNTGVVAAQSLAGKQIGELREQYVMDIRGDLSHLTPSGWCLCHQDEFEPLLRAKAQELGAKIEFGTELLSFTQDEQGVRAKLSNRAVRAKYLIAADGPGSRIRQACSISFEGTEPIGNYMNIHFKAKLKEQLGDRRFVMCYVMNQELRGALMPIDNDQRWLLHVMYDPKSGEEFTTERCTQLVKAAAGVPDLDVEIIGAMPWEAAGRTAGRFSDRRVFIVGDAAHVMPPSGAFGSNTGIQDSYNLAWKIAAVLRNEAGPALLDTYDAERRPTGEAIVEQAVLRSLDRPRMVHEQPPPADPRIVPDTTVWFGSRYHSTAIVPDNDEKDVWANEIDGTPGVRAPYDESTWDLYGDGFVLIASNDEWIKAAEGLSIKAHKVEGAEALLVRPDGVVAWRPAGAASADELARALKSVLSLN